MASPSIPMPPDLLPDPLSLQHVLNNSSSLCSPTSPPTAVLAYSEPMLHHSFGSTRKEGGDILECKVKWAIGSITKNKESGADEIPVELFQILRDDAVKVLHSVC